MLSHAHSFWKPDLSIAVPGLFRKAKQFNHKELSFTLQWLCSNGIFTICHSEGSNKPFQAFRCYERRGELWERGNRRDGLPFYFEHKFFAQSFHHYSKLLKQVFLKVWPVSGVKLNWKIVVECPVITHTIFFPFLVRHASSERLEQGVKVMRELDRTSTKWSPLSVITLFSNRLTAVFQNLRFRGCGD